MTKFNDIIQNVDIHNGILRGSLAHQEGDDLEPKSIIYNI